MLPRIGTRATFEDESRDCSKACKLCSLLSRTIKVSRSHVVAKRASAEPIEPPPPVITTVFPEMYSFSRAEEGTQCELPANSVQMFSPSCGLSIIAVNLDYEQGDAVRFFDESHGFPASGRPQCGEKSGYTPFRSARRCHRRQKDCIGGSCPCPRSVAAHRTRTLELH